MTWGGLKMIPEAAEGLFLYAGSVIATLLLRRYRIAQLYRSRGNFDEDDVPSLSRQKIEFWSQWTGEVCEEALIVSNWRALKKQFHTYRCIQGMSYLVPRVARHSAYERVLAKFKTSGDIKIADFGCCFGQDDRKLILDGVPARCITVVDIHDGYYKAGMELFKDTGSGRLAGIKECWFDISLPFGHSSSLEAKFPDAEGTFDFVILQAVLHTMSLEQHRVALTRILRLLKKESGILLGMTVGAVVAQPWVRTPDGQAQRYLHSTSSLSALFTELGYRSSEVVQRDRGGEDWGRAQGQGSSIKSTSEALGGAARAMVEFTASA